MAKTKSSQSILTKEVPSFLGVIIIVVTMLPLFGLAILVKNMQLDASAPASSQNETWVMNPFPDPTSYKNPFPGKTTTYTNPFAK